MKNLIRKLLKRMGILVCRYRVENSFEFTIIEWLNKNNIQGLLDVGANSGQFAATMREQGYNGMICSFEPQSSAFKSMEKNGTADNKWQKQNCAVGETNGRISINISENSWSSSILEISKRHTDAAPDSRYNAKEDVEIRRLDSFDFPSNVFGDKLYLKIDTQGFEEQVLNGVGNLMPRIAAVQLELSTVTLYKGAKLHREMIDHMYSLGFELFSLERGYCEPGSGQLLQFEVFFVKKAQ